MKKKRNETKKRLRKVIQFSYNTYKQENYNYNKYLPKDKKKPLSIIGSGLMFAFSLITALFSLLVFYNLGSFKDIKDYCKQKENSDKAVCYWKEDLEKVRIGNSSRYIEEIIGVPQATERIVFCEKEYLKNMYINSYFTLICVYDDAEELIGFLLIGNNPKFNMRNYRVSFNLFDNTINETEKICNEKIGPVVICKSFKNGRLDCNSYYFECNLQHPKGATEMYYIGYGVCDIGYLTSLKEYNEATKSMSVYDMKNETFQQYHEKSINDSIRNQPINALFIMKEFRMGASNTMEFINTYVVGNTVMGISRDRYSNYQPDYEKSVSYYMDAIRTNSEDTEESEASN